MKKLAVAFVALILSAGLVTSCTDADVVSQKLSQDADYFKVQRRILFYNTVPMVGVVNLLEIEGLCSLGNNDPVDRPTVTCMTGPGQYKKHFLHLSGSEGYFVEQTEGLGESPYHYRVVFKPSALVPSFEVR